MVNYFTSDLHLGHSNIVKFCYRPFDTIDEMNKALIDNWNARVNSDDHVYCLGDLSLKDPRNYLLQLNGTIHMVFGNHDKQKFYWKSIHSKHGEVIVHCDYHEFEVDNQLICLSHYPHVTWKNSHRGSIMLFGHIHGGLEGNDQTTDVGVDVWDYKPVTLEEIKTRLKTLPKYPSFKFAKGNRKAIVTIE